MSLLLQSLCSSASLTAVFKLIFCFLLCFIIPFHFIPSYSSFASSTLSSVHVLFTFPPMTFYFSFLTSLTPTIYPSSISSSLVCHFLFSFFSRIPYIFFIFHFYFLPFLLYLTFRFFVLSLSLTYP